ncbi:hypothetical protein DAPPUDRAFT_261496 [Daphnia pulex]|uniref:JmjC domain-containing protein n=1 Tax=Daphnia pulex TaxID=6669 RepID=E9HL44_DAPPU|nr:hypothetical protein DAPPUDRAFT_261496 [Daphnia pulex]|eukprot:EFX67541.1 hypothetical protein DAPPUDRAFT_261496 [Daphnia pulex]
MAKNLDVLENSGLVLTPTQEEMDQFEPYILQTYRNNWEEHGAFIVRPPTKLKHVTVGEFIEASLKADKAKRGALYSSTTKLKMPIWFAMLHHIKNVSEGREQKPQYLPNLRRTFRQFLHNPDEIIEGVNVPQIFLGQLGSFSAWHVEDLNLFSINKHHFGEPKHWIAVSYKYTEELRQLFRDQVPHYYDSCEAADWHKEIPVFPQMLIAHSPPIPFHTLKQCEGDYVVTCPSAFHFVLNEGANVAEAMNYPISKEDMKKEIAMLKEELEKVKAKKEEIEKALKKPRY